MEEHSHPVEPHDHPHTHPEIDAALLAIDAQQGEINALADDVTELVAIAERQQITMEMIQDAIPGLMLVLGVIVGVLLVSIFSSGMRNAS